MAGSGGNSLAATGSGRLDSTTLIGFLILCLIAGMNFVGVRFSNFELKPFWGAGFRFALAGTLFLIIALWRGAEAPRGKALQGTFWFGVLSFGLSYALMYWALVTVTAGTGSVVLSLVPLATLLMAVGVGLERFRWPAAFGAILAAVGIAVIFRDQIQGTVSPGALAAMLGVTLSISAANIVAKRYPRIDLASMNALAMFIGAAILLGISRAVGEPWLLPTRAATWTAFLYLVLIGSVLMFALYLFLVRRWTASGVSFQFVIQPVVAILAGHFLANEPISLGLVAGGLLILVGVYVGALRRAPAPTGSQAQKTST